MNAASNDLGPKALNNLHPELGALWIAHLRRAIVDFLAAAPGYIAPMELVKDAVRLLGFAVDTNTAREQMMWLADRQLAKCVVTDDRSIISLTASGLDVSAGVLEVEGISRFLPPF